jgi:hypothetical protein
MAAAIGRRAIPSRRMAIMVLDLAGAIIADLEVTEDRIDESLYAVEGWHPDLRRVVVIEGSAEAVLVSEVPLPDL